MAAQYSVSFRAVTSIALVICTLTAVSMIALAQPEDTPLLRIDVWTRAPGTYGKGKPAPTKLDVQTLTISSVKLKTIERYDIQYNRSRRYRGVDLVDVIAQYPESTRESSVSTDLALLHFSNGVIVPVLRKYHLKHDFLRVFVATAIWSDEKKQWLETFPDAPQEHPDVVDIRPIAFTGNKMVVDKKWHPLVPKRFGPFVNPWRHAGSLVGIEFVNSAAYAQQLHVSDEPIVNTGEKLFQQTCQFCHGVRGVGATFGPDLIDPHPVFAYKENERSLFYHVTYRVSDAPARGIRMPALKTMTEAEVSALWQWFRTIGTNPINPYRPTVINK